MRGGAGEKKRRPLGRSLYARADDIVNGGRFRVWPAALLGALRGLLELGQCFGTWEALSERRTAARARAGWLVLRRAAHSHPPFASPLILPPYLRFARFRPRRPVVVGEPLPVLSILLSAAHRGPPQSPSHNNPPLPHLLSPIYSPLQARA